MSSEKGKSQNEHSDPTDAFMNEDYEGKILRPESVRGVGFANKSDEAAHQPENTSQEHSLDDTQELQAPDCLEVDPAGEAAEHATKEDEEK